MFPQPTPFFFVVHGRLAPGLRPADQPRTARRLSVAGRAVHLRMPSIDQGVQAFVWAVVFFLFMWLGALAVGFSGWTSFVISLLAAGAIFLLVRVRGGDYPS